MFVTDSCKDCVSCCAHAGKDREFICPGGVSCKITKRRGMTNADRIRAMSDEELAELLCSMTYCYECSYKNACTHDDGYLDWLRQPAEKA